MPASKIRALYHRDGNGATADCYICGRDLLRYHAYLQVKDELKRRTRRKPPSKYPTLDHVIPRALGGTDAISNLKLACKQCNGLKAANLDEELIETDCENCWSMAGKNQALHQNLIDLSDQVAKLKSHIASLQQEIQGGPVHLGMQRRISLMDKIIKEQQRLLTQRPPTPPETEENDNRPSSPD